MGLIYFTRLRQGYGGASPYDCSSSSSSVTLVKTPSGALGSSGAGFRISAFVKPGVTSPAVARTVHHDGFRCIFAILKPSAFARRPSATTCGGDFAARSEEHTSEL